MKSNLSTVISNIQKDFLRYTNQKNPILLLYNMFHDPGMIFSVLYRFERFFLYESNSLFKFIGRLCYPFYYLVTYYILSYHIEPLVKIGPGLFLHNKDVVITDAVEIGENFSIMGQTTIGTNFFSGGQLVIGDGVWVGAGAKIIISSDMVIVNNVVIGSNAVVTKSIKEENAIYSGIPAKLINYRKF